MQIDLKDRFRVNFLPMGKVAIIFGRELLALFRVEDNLGIVFNSKQRNW